VLMEGGRALIKDALFYALRLILRWHVSLNTYPGFPAR
jgi:hypothetical protein